MRCPCCGKEMSEKYIDESYTDLTWGDDPIPDGHYFYKCKECKISYDEDDGWSTPRKYVPTITEKQINCLCYLFSVPRNDYTFRSGLVSKRYTPNFDHYIPEVMSRAFASSLIREKKEEQEREEARLDRRKLFDSILDKHNISPYYTYNNYYVQKNKGYDVRIKFDVEDVEKGTNYGIHLDDVVVAFKDITASFDKNVMAQELTQLAKELNEAFYSKGE